LLEYGLFSVLTAIFGDAIPPGLGFGSSSFYTNGSLIYLTLLLVRLAFVLWSFVVSVIALAEVQQLTVGKTIFSLILSSLILLLPFFLLSELNKWIFQML
jgi:hypothetical protein